MAMTREQAKAQLAQSKAIAASLNGETSPVEVNPRAVAVFYHVSDKASWHYDPEPPIWRRKKHAEWEQRMLRLGLPRLDKRTGMEVVVAENARTQGMDIAWRQYAEAREARATSKDNIERHARELQVAAAERKLRAELDNFAPVRNPNQVELSSEMRDVVATMQYALMRRAIDQGVKTDRELQQMDPHVVINREEGNNLYLELRQGAKGWDLCIKKAFASDNAARAASGEKTVQQARDDAFDRVIQELRGQASPIDPGDYLALYEQAGQARLLERLDEARRTHRAALSPVVLETLKVMDEINTRFVAEATFDGNQTKKFVRKGNPRFMDKNFTGFLGGVIKQTPILNG